MRIAVSSIAVLLGLLLFAPHNANAEFKLALIEGSQIDTQGAVNINGQFNLQASTDLNLPANTSELLRITNVVLDTSVGRTSPDVSISLSTELQNHLASNGTSPQFRLNPDRVIPLLDYTISPNAFFGAITEFTFSFDFASDGVDPFSFTNPPPSAGGSFSFNGWVATPEPSAGLAALFGAVYVMRRRKRS
ncbi:MAG: hypothetical protein AAF483_25930 [Planctomycetota bacterium]